jgi:hypothetical protein
MDSENQALMMRLAEEHGKEKLVVVLGAADPEGVEISAETLTIGDPSLPAHCRSPLAPRVHILEPEFKRSYLKRFQEKLGILN